MPFDLEQNIEIGGHGLNLSHMWDIQSYLVYPRRRMSFRGTIRRSR